MNDTDKSLIDAHRRGDAEAFGHIVRRYGDGVLGYLMRITAHGRMLIQNCKVKADNYE